MGFLIVVATSFILHLFHQAALVLAGPIDTSFAPEKAREGFKCEYPGYVSCHSEDDRSCWVEKDGKTYDIDTDYEDDFPVGIIRTVSAI